MTCGIYGIKNKLNDKIYVGQSINIEQRFKTHLRELKQQNHSNQKLLNSFNKYGIDNFELITLEICIKDLLPWKEQEWVDKYPKEMLFNEVFDVQFRTGDSNPFYGKKHSTDSKLKMSEWKKKHYLAENNPNFGKKNNKKTRIKMSEGRSRAGAKNETLNEEKVLKIVNFLKQGIPHQQIAKIFNVGRTTITRISTGDRWSNVTGGPVVPTIYKNGKRILSINHLKNKLKVL